MRTEWGLKIYLPPLGVPVTFWAVCKGWPHDRVAFENIHTESLLKNTWITNCNDKGLTYNNGVGWFY